MTDDNADKNPNLSEDVLRRLVEGEDVPATEHAPNKPPCLIYTQANSTGCFVVKDINAWTWNAIGIEATGCWRGYDDTRDVLIPHEKIDYIEFDHVTLDAWEETQKSDD